MLLRQPRFNRHRDRDAAVANLRDLRAESCHHPLPGEAGADAFGHARDSSPRGLSRTCSAGSADNREYDGGDNGYGCERQRSGSLPRFGAALASGETEDGRRSREGTREAEPEDNERNDGEDPDDQATESRPRYARDDPQNSRTAATTTMALATRK